jgi:hypothetical protein
MSTIDDPTPITPDPVAPTAAAQLATALEWLDHPRGFKLDALEACIKALALANAELEADLASIKGVLHRLAKQCDLMSGRVKLLEERWPKGDGR